MSTTPTAPPPTQTSQMHEVKIYSHSSLFYWWPVWAIGFILGLLTLTRGQVMYVVPKGTDVRVVDEENGKVRKVELTLKEPVDKKLVEDPPKRYIASSAGYGVFFTVVLMVVIVITNVPLRGMWSVMVIMLIVLLSIIFALAGWWDNIIEAIRLLDVRMNAGGYFSIASALLGIWLITFLLFDRQLYITFLPGMMKVCLEIGSGEKTYDTMGMTIEKERSDLFRHWILGLGSGDLIVKTSGAERHEFRLTNVLFIGQKLAMIEEMQRVKDVR